MQSGPRAVVSRSRDPLSDSTKRWLFVLPTEYRSIPPSSASLLTFRFGHARQLMRQRRLLLGQVSMDDLSRPGDTENDDLVSLHQPFLHPCLGPHDLKIHVVYEPFSDLRITTLSPESFWQLQGLTGETLSVLWEDWHRRAAALRGQHVRSTGTCTPAQRCGEPTG